jgi:hypothetical protein
MSGNTPSPPPPDRPAGQTQPGLIPGAPPPPPPGKPAPTGVQKPLTIPAWALAVGLFAALVIGVAIGGSAEGSSKDNQIEDLEAQVVDLEVELAKADDSEVSIDDLAEEVDELRERNEELGDELDAVKGERDELEAQVAAATTTVAPTTPTTTAPVVASPAPLPPPAFAAPPPPVSGYFENCTAARAAGAAPVYAGDPGYGPHLDRDGDGVGCE